MSTLQAKTAALLSGCEASTRMFGVANEGAGGPAISEGTKVVPRPSLS